MFFRSKRKLENYFQIENFINKVIMIIRLLTYFEKLGSYKTNYE